MTLDEWRRKYQIPIYIKTPLRYVSPVDEIYANLAVMIWKHDIPKETSVEEINEFLVINETKTSFNLIHKSLT